MRFLNWGTTKHRFLKSFSLTGTTEISFVVQSFRYTVDAMGIIRLVKSDIVPKTSGWVRFRAAQVKSIRNCRWTPTAPCVFGANKLFHVLHRSAPRRRAYDVSKHDCRTRRLELPRKTQQGQMNAILRKNVCWGHSEQRRAIIRELSW